MARVKVTLTHGKNGGRAVAWIAGVPQGFTRQYEFPAGKPLEIDEVDADALAAGKIDAGGRVFDVPKRAAAPTVVILDNDDRGAPAPKAKA